MQSRTAISLLVLILFCNFISAFDLSIDYPKNVEINSPFTVSISTTSSTSKIFDVKIFIHNSSDEKVSRDEIISSILDNGGWKDSYLYIQDAYPLRDYFSLRIDSKIHSSSKICVQLREQNKTAVYVKKCEDLRVNDNSHESYPAENTDSTNLMFMPEDNSDEPIKLTTVKKVYVSNSAIQTRIISYTFTIIALIVIILIFLRKL